MTEPEVENLNKLASVPAIPFGQLRVQIANFRHIDSGKGRPCIYYVGGGSGSHLILLIVICFLLYWCFKKTQNPVPTCVAYTAPVNPNMMHTRMGAISTDKYSELGQETVWIQDPVGTQSKAMNNDRQHAFATALVDQLEDYGANINEHHRRLRTRQYPAKPQMEAKTSLEIQSE